MIAPAKAGAGPSPRDEARFQFTLYVSGASDLSRRAIVGAKAVCDAYVAGRYDLTVLDLETNAEAASGAGILATPTLLRTHPSPQRRFVGDLADVERVVLALELPGGPEPAVPDL
jgi:circadian clock protein KaiB